MTERDERIVLAGLRAYAEETRHREAPPELEDLLRRQVSGRRKLKLPLRVVWMATAAMLAVGLFAGLWLWKQVQLGTQGQGTATVLPNPAPPQTLPTSPPDLPRVGQPLAMKTVRPAVARPGRRESVTETIPAQVLTPWYVNSALPAITRGQVMRIEVSQETAASFGVYAPSGAVRADLLIGDDGLARAIRFVR